MTCLRPIKAFKSITRNVETGKHGITFNPLHGLVEGSSLSVPCGKCIACRVTRAQQWAVRCMHEAQLHRCNSFLTLTYSDKHLPSDYSIDVRTLQLFQKRLRKKLGTTRVRYFGCGEYGGVTLRPHYHQLVFGWFPADAKLYKQTEHGPLFTSAELDEVWGYGDCKVGSVTFKSARYTAGYVIKKIGGDPAPDHYRRVHPLSGKLVQVQPEFSLKSTNPGIGAGWFDLYKADAFPSDYLIVDGHRVPVPKYYTDKLAEEEAHKIKITRRLNNRSRKADQTPQRLAVREEVLTSRINLKPKGNL